MAGAGLHSGSLTLTSDPANAGLLRREIRAFLRDSGIGAEETERFVLAVNEAFANIVEHAYEGSHDGEVEVRMEESEDRVEVLIRDFGRKPDPDSLCGRELDDVRPGGLGLHFMQAGADEVDFDFSLDRGTRLRLVKRKEGASS
jgi:anti-sigma regulatory factor (Ser/Thr protein kinase)